MRHLENFKIIKLIQNEEEIYNEFSTASYGYARANIINNTLNQLPRLSLETIGFGVFDRIVVYILFEYECKFCFTNYFYVCIGTL